MGLGTAAAADTGFVFISHEKSNTVVVLDPARDHAVIKTIPTSRRPRDMHFDLAHEVLYVACGDDDVIDVIDVDSLSVVDHIPTGLSPEVFDLGPDGKTLYVAEEEHAIVRHIDIATRDTIGQIATGPEPEGVLVTRDGTTIYVASEVADMVHVVDAAKGRATHNILVGTRPRRFALSPDKTELWVSDELAGQVSVIERATNSVKTTVPFLPPGCRAVDVTPVGLALSKDGGTMFVTLGRANHVAFVDPATKEIRAYVLTGHRPWGVAQGADGALLYVANGLVGPPLDFMGERIFIAGMLRNTPANMVTWLRNPQDVVPGNAMPDTGLSEAQARDVTAYLYTLRR